MNRQNFLQPSFGDASKQLIEGIDSKCMYCGSAYYGSGCIYSSHGIHVHAGNDGKCIYCGSLYYGSGCIFNPHNNIHIHGADVTTSIKETTRKTLEMSYIFERLLFDVRETAAFKLDLIDEKGKQKRTPTNLYESQLVSPLNKAIYKLRKFIPDDAFIIKESYKHLSGDIEDNIETFEEEVKFSNDIKYAVEMLISSLKKYHDILPSEKIEKIIEDTILNSI